MTRSAISQLDVSWPSLKMMTRLRLALFLGASIMTA
jgi:hypothetical protein